MISLVQLYSFNQQDTYI